MTTTTWYESNYRYTGPIRFFQANDPYYYKVDNIPLKQMAENEAFLKDQVEGLLKRTATIEIDRGGFTELQPYVNGSDSVVRVKAGKYSARINDAYAIDPIQFLTQTLGFSNLEANSWKFETNLGAQVSAVLEQIKSSVADDALNMNGLAERALTWPMRSNDLPSEFVGSATPEYLNNSITGMGSPSWPGFTGQTWTNGYPTSSLIRETVNSGGFTGGDYPTSNKAESIFVKRWRGAIRTAIVDVPEELTIEVPKFDDEDFFYKDEDGNKVLLDANQRIDLVFIYSKAIDQKSTTIASYSNGAATTITAPTLGIVKGAGVGMSLRKYPAGAGGTDIESIQTPDGTPLMLPHIADENGTAGFSGTLKGSFPSPDDLMNLAPLLSENLESNSLALIGQSILPVAYVIVKKSATLNSSNVPIVAEADVIDIRPFFRTAELAYNERGGIAAATPQISLANPVASESYVTTTVRDVVADYSTKVNNVTQRFNTTPRIVGSGYVKGGFHYGVESVLGDFIRQNNNVNDVAQAKSLIVSKHGYPTGTIIPDLPDWDIAEWCRRGNYGNKGAFPNDRINFHTFGPTFTGGASLPYGAFKVQDSGAGFGAGSIDRIETLGTDGLQGGALQGNLTATGHSCIYFVKKKVQLDRTQVEWADDYHVDVQLWNCAPMSCRSHKDGANTSLAANASVWVDKRQDFFTIYVSWVASDWHNAATSPGGSEPGNSNVLPYLSRNDGQRFAGFSVINDDMLDTSYIHARTPGEAAAGVAVYPTVSFQVYGIPSGFSANAVNLNSENPVLSLA